MATTNKRFVAKNGLDNNNQTITNIGAAGTSLGLSGTGDLTIAISGTATLTIPAGSDTLVTLSGSQTLTNKTISGSNNTISNIGNGSLTNSSVSFNGVSVALGASGTLYTDDISEDGTPVNLWFTNTRARSAISVTDSGGDGSLSYDSGTGVITYTGPSASEVRAHLSAGTGLTFTTGQFAIDSTVATLTGTQTLTNKTISGADNTLSNIGNSSLSNSSITINGTSVSLGGTRTLVTDDIAEDGSPINLWYTDTRSRAAISVIDAGGDGSLSYNSGTGAITYTGPSASEVRAHFSAGTGVTLSSGQISIGQAVATTDNVTFAGVTADNVRIGVTAAGEIDTSAGNLTIDSTGGTTVLDDDVNVTGNMTVDGNLTVSGTTVTINATNLAVEDNMIYLNSGSTVTHPDLGFAGNYNDGTYRHAGLFRDESDGRWKFFHQYTPEPDASAYIDITHASFALAPVQASSFIGSVTGNVTGNASTATTWQTARTLTLSGDVTGTSAAFDGSGNISITTAIAADSVALGTDTTGDYVAAVAVSGTGLSVSGSGENATYTITSNATSANTASTIVARDASGNFTAGTITAALSGNATSATTAGTITSQANSATITATSANTANQIVLRDASGNFSAGTITATLSGNATSATSASNSTTTSQRAFTSDISTTGQGRFTGWYTGNAATGLAAEIGISGGEGYVFTYNRDTSTYGTMNFAAASANLKISGGTINATSGALQQGGNQVLHAGNYTSYSTSWANVGSGTRTDYGLDLRPPSSGNYAGFSFSKSTSANGATDAGYFLIRGGTSGDVYTAEGITLVADAGWLTLAQRTTASRGVRIMSGSSTSTERLLVTTAGDIQFVNGNSFTYGGNAILHAGNYNSYSPTLTGTGASGTWSIRVTGFANAGSQRLYSTDAAYNYDSANPYYGYLTYIGANNRWRFQVLPATPAAVEVAYADTAGSAPANGGTSTEVNGSRFSTTASSYVNFYTWAHFHGGTAYGLYFPSSGSMTHMYPSATTYGSFMVDGSRNGYWGAMFSTGVGNAGWMTTGNTTGFYNHTYGWKYYHENGAFYIYSGAYGGGTQYTALHSGNYSSYALPLSGGTLTGDLVVTDADSVLTIGNAGTDACKVIAASGDELYIGGINSYRLRFTTGGNVVMDNGGALGIGTASPATTLDVRGGILRTNSRITNSQKYPVGHYTPGETVFEIDPTWTQSELQEFFGSSGVSWVSDSTAPGGYAIQVAGPVYVGGAYNSGFPYIPVDQDDVFMMECWIKDVAGTNGHYMGSIDYNASFSSLGGNPGSYGYWVMLGNYPGTSWTRYVGYIGGFGGSTGQFVSGTKYWTPQALFNYAGQNTSYISGWKAIKVSHRGNHRFLNNVGIGGGHAPDVALSVNGYVHIGNGGNYLYMGGTVGNYGSWGSRHYTSGGNHTINANAFQFDNVGYGSTWTVTFNGSGITASGNITAYSDIRLKENIMKIENALYKVQQLRGITYTRNDTEDKTKRHAGVIAQEVEQVLPEVVDETSSGIKHVAYGNMIGLLIEAIKELKHDNEQLHKRIQQWEDNS